MGSGGNDYQNQNLKKYDLPEMAMEASGQLYNLSNDPGEKTNLFFTEAEKRMELQELLKLSKESGRSAPENRIPLGMNKLKELRKKT